MAQKRLYSTAYGNEQDSPHKACKFGSASPSKFDKPRVFSPNRYRQEVQEKSWGDGDDSEAENEDEEDVEISNVRNTDDRDREWTYLEDDEGESSDEDCDDETDENYSEEGEQDPDGDEEVQPTDSGYDSATYSQDRDCSTPTPRENPPQELTSTTKRGNTFLKLTNFKPADVDDWLHRKRFTDSNDFPLALILDSCSLTHEQLSLLLECIQPSTLALHNYCPADGFWGQVFKIAGDRNMMLSALRVHAGVEEMSEWKVERRGGHVMGREWPGEGLKVRMTGREEVQVLAGDMVKQFEEFAGRGAVIF